MAESESSKEIEKLRVVTEKQRVRLKETLGKVARLDAAIKTAREKLRPRPKPRSRSRR